MEIGLIIGIAVLFVMGVMLGSILSEVRRTVARRQRLQKIRTRFGKPVTINSAYRTAAHNGKVGGSPNSQHLYGLAADIVVEGAAPREVARYAETVLAGKGGIGLYKWGVHVDVRAKRSRWNSTSGREVAVSGF